jgi:hypothetical protein
MQLVVNLEMCKKFGNKIEMRGLESHACPVDGMAEGNPPRNERLLTQLSC